MDHVLLPLAVTDSAPSIEPFPPLDVAALAMSPRSPYCPERRRVPRPSSRLGLNAAVERRTAPGLRNLGHARTQSKTRPATRRSSRERASARRSHVGALRRGGLAVL